MTPVASINFVGHTENSLLLLPAVWYCMKRRNVCPGLLQDGEEATGGPQYEYEYVYEYEDVEDANKKVHAPAPVPRDQPPGHDQLTTS